MSVLCCFGSLSCSSLLSAIFSFDVVRCRLIRPFQHTLNICVIVSAQRTVVPSQIHGCCGGRLLWRMRDYRGSNSTVVDEMSTANSELEPERLFSQPAVMPRNCPSFISRMQCTRHTHAQTTHARLVSSPDGSCPDLDYAP